MSLADNLDMGQKAVTYVKGLIPQASNQRSDRLASFGGIDKLIDLWRGASPDDRSKPELGFTAPVSTAVSTMRASVPAASSYAKLIGEMARKAAAAKVGNCGEQAALAFLWLYTKGVRPLDYVSFATKKEKTNSPYLDHAFVVIGRDASSTTVKQDSKGNNIDVIDDLRTWGDEAVWCDPWQLGEGRVFTISDFIKGSVRNLDWQYQLDTADRVEAGCPISRNRED